MPRPKMKKNKDTRTVTITLPDELYVQLKQWANEEVRSLPNQARYFLQIGMKYIEAMHQEADESEKSESGEEQEPCIGFRVEQEELDEEE